MDLVSHAGAWLGFRGIPQEFNVPRYIFGLQWKYGDFRLLVPPFFLFVFYLVTPGKPVYKSFLSISYSGLFTVILQSKKMRLSYVRTFLIWILATLNSACACGTCIEYHQVESIAQRWLNDFAAGALHTLPEAVTENFAITLENSQLIL